jgi:FecR protein
VRLFRNLHWKFLTSPIAAGILFFAGHDAASDPPKKEARVTKIIRDVNILPSDAPPRTAAENDQVNENTALRTGDESRSELTFDDMTITRLGENTLFSFNKAGRSGDLGSGTILVYVPKNSGGAEFKTKAVTVGVAGTTFIFEATRLGNGKLIVLEGNTRMHLVKHPGEVRNVRAGQMLDVKAGANQLPMPVDVDLAQIMQTHPLIKDFAPLPSQELIVAAIREQQGPASGKSPVSQGQPVLSRTPAPVPAPAPAPAPSIVVGVGIGIGGPTSPSPPVPVVSVSANPTEVNEEERGVYTITSANVNPGVPRAIKYSMSGTGRRGRDYTLSGAGGQVTIPAGANSANVILTVLGRNSRENQTARMILQPGRGYKLSSQRAATITILRTIRSSTPSPTPTPTPFPVDLTTETKRTPTPTPFPIGLTTATKRTPTPTPFPIDLTTPPKRTPTPTPFPIYRTPPPKPTPMPGLIHLPPKPSPTPRVTPTKKPKGGAAPHKTPRPTPRPTRPPKENHPPLGTIKPPKKGLPSPTPAPAKIF